MWAVELDRVEEALGHAAEMYGDITPMVMERFYKKYPEVESLFAELSLGRSREMEGEMVTQSIYCLMAIFGNPITTKIMLQEAIVNHLYLKISCDYFNGLIESTVDVVISSLDGDLTECTRALNLACAQLTAVVSAGYADIEHRLGNTMGN